MYKIFQTNLNLGGHSEISEALSEIQKVDPNFDKNEWLRFCEKEIIPNVLEALIRGDLNILKDWCYERVCFFFGFFHFFSNFLGIS